MVKKNIDEDQLMDDYEDEGEMEFAQSDELDFSAEEELLLDEEGEDDYTPSVLYKGISRPKTEDDWRQLLLEASKDGVPEYKLTESYKEGALILHPVFGLGVVSKVISQRKMEVVFDTNKKLMAMNVTPPQ
jgi:hypothetical protein